MAISKCQIELMDNKFSCNNIAEWEVGFSGIIECSSMAFLAGDEMEFSRKVCDKHFLDCDSAGNTICFKKIGNEKWILKIGFKKLGPEWLDWNGEIFDKLFPEIWYKVDRNKKLEYFLLRD